MANNSAHNGHNFIWRLLHWGEPQRHTDETPVVQPQFRIVHQDEARRLQNRFLVWCDEQPVLRPRLVTETQPKLRERAGHIQEVTPQVVEYKPRGHWEPDGHGGLHWVLAQRTTDGMQPVSAPSTPIPEVRAQEHKQAEQVQKFDPSQLPSWLQNLRDNSLPVERQHPVENVPSAPLPSFIESKPGELMTLRQPSIPLPPFLGFSDPDVVPDLPTEPRKPGDFAEDPWINGAMLPLLADPAPDEPAAGDKTNEMSENSGLGPMPSQEVWDRHIAVIREAERAQLLTIPEEAMKPDLEDEDPEGTAQASALWKLRHCERVKGLE